MKESYASMVLGGDARNVEQLGAYIAWLVNNRMFTDYVERVSEDAITGVRLQSTTGADFLATDLHGELMPSHLTETGQQFTEHYLLSGLYDAHYESVEFDGENEWIRYGDLAPLISSAFREFQHKDALPGSGVVNKVAKILQFPSRKK